VLATEIVGKALPCRRSSASLARRSATIWFSSWVWPSGGSFGGSLFLLMTDYTPCFKLALMNSSRSPSRTRCVSPFPSGAQVLDARLVEHVGANLMSPLDVGLGGLELVAVGLELAQFQLVQA